MKKILYILPLIVCLTGCNVNQKPPLSETQIVNGASIVMPPEFYVLPKQKAQNQQ